MINSKNIENFWTRGDIFSRVHHAMSEAGLINKKLKKQGVNLTSNADGVSH